MVIMITSGMSGSSCGEAHPPYYVIFSSPFYSHSGWMLQHALSKAKFPDSLHCLGFGRLSQHLRNATAGRAKSTSRQGALPAVSMIHPL